MFLPLYTLGSLALYRIGDWVYYLAIWYVVTPRCISTSPKRKVKNNIGVIDYFAGDNEIYE